VETFQQVLKTQKVDKAKRIVMKLSFLVGKKESLVKEMGFGDCVVSFCLSKNERKSNIGVQTTNWCHGIHLTRIIQPSLS